LDACKRSIFELHCPLKRSVFELYFIKNAAFLGLAARKRSVFELLSVFQHYNML